MASQEPASRSSLTSVPNVDDLPRTADGGFEEGAVREAFDTFRRSMLQLQAQLRVVQAAGQTGPAEPIGHSVRMDALRLIRAAAEFADVLERDAQTASAEQYSRVEEEVRKRHRELRQHQADLEVRRADVERDVAELLSTARNEARELRTNAEREAEAVLRDAEARGARLLEQSRHQATELTNAARADVAQTLDWARAQASTIIARAQEGAEQLLGAAGLGREEVERITQALVSAATGSSEGSPLEAPASPPSSGSEGTFARLDPDAPSPRPGSSEPGPPLTPRPTAEVRKAVESGGSSAPLVDASGPTWTPPTGSSQQPPGSNPFGPSLGSSDRGADVVSPPPLPGPEAQ